jgi:hypothetical protein
MSNNKVGEASHCQQLKQQRRRGTHGTIYCGSMPAGRRVTACGHNAARRQRFSGQMTILTWYGSLDGGLFSYLIGGGHDAVRDGFLRQRTALTLWRGKFLPADARPAASPSVLSAFNTA